MVVRRTDVSILVGEERREGDFPIDETLETVAAVLLAKEQSEARRVRLIFGGIVRPLSTSLLELSPRLLERGNRAGALTLHAVVGPPNSLYDQPPAPGGFGAPSDDDQTRFASRGGGGADNDCLDVAGIKLQPGNVLFSLTAAFIGICCYAMFAIPSVRSVPAVIFTAICATVWLAAAARKLGCTRGSLHALGSRRVMGGAAR